jgi:hypothetical protein
VGAVAVAEHAPVHLAAELAHFVALVVAGESAGLIVECFDLRVARHEYGEHISHP